MLFSTTVPAFASDESSDVLTETVQDVEEAGESTKEEEFFENEKNEPDVDDSKNSNADAEDSKDSEADVEDSKDSNADVEAPEEGEADVEESPEPSEEPADAPVYKLDMPKVSRLTNTPEGVEISWREVSGAEKYRVFLLDEAGNWTELADTTATRYVWTGAQEGIAYTFTVRCVSADGETFTSGFDKVGMSITYTSAQPDEDEADTEKSGEGEADGEGLEEGEADTEETDESVVGLGEFVIGGIVGADEPQTLDGSIALLAFPITTTPEATLLNTPEGVLISWGKINSAEKYRVFRMNESGGWTKLGDTTATNYLWTGAKKDTFYVFTVRCVSADGKSFTSDYNKTGWGISYTPTQLKTPDLETVKFEDTAEGVKLTWSAVTGAQKYRLFYRNDAGGWTKIADTTSASYLWTGAKDKKDYLFTIRCVSTDGSTFTSGYDKNGIGHIYNQKVCAAPELDEPINTSEGVKISWGTVAGASKYRVFYKGGTAKSWTIIGDTTSTSYTWTGATKDTKYTFTVRCVSSDGKTYISSYNKTGVSITYKPATLGTPSLQAVTNTPKGVTIEWKAVPDAKKYRVFYKGGTAKTWTIIGDTTSTSYIWTGAQSGTQYTFTVRCVSSDGKAYTSSYESKGMTITYKPAQLATPMLTPLTCTSKGIAISWEPVEGAQKYRVFRQNESGGWTKIIDTTGVGYVWTEAEEGMRYTFTVRCISSDGKTYISGYDAAGKSILYQPSESDQLDTPQVVAVAAPKNSVAISWGAIDGAEKYRVFYSASSANGPWTKLADTTSTAYTWTGAKGGEYFTVRCVSADGKTFTSEQAPSVQVSSYTSADGYAAPTNLSATNTLNGVALSWDEVEGAQKYRVFYSTSSAKGPWTTIADTTSTSYTWDGAKNGLSYYFAVRCLTSDGAFVGDDYATYGSHTYKPVELAIPELNKPTQDQANPNQVTISWNAVTGAEKYRVFYKINGTGGWKQLVDTTDTDYTWVEAEGGNKYTFTVRCLSSDGKSYLSSYNQNGESIEIALLNLPTNLEAKDDPDKGVVVSWTAVPGAFKYRVYYKSGTLEWTPIGETTSTEYVWTDATPGETYQFLVYCVSYDGSAVTSIDDDSNPEELKVDLLSAPELTTVRNASGGVEIIWNAVSRAQKYRVFYQVEGAASWTKLADTTATSYLWTGAKASTKYVFKVVCISADGASETSGESNPKDIETVGSALQNILAKGSYQQSSANAVVTLINALRNSADDSWYWDEKDSNKLPGSRSSLVYNASLEQIAMQRAAELVQWYSNTRPDNTPFSSLVCNNVSSSCEIIAKGSSAQTVFDTWAASNKGYSGQANRRILLSGEYTQIGAACFQYNGTTYWVLEFGK